MATNLCNGCQSFFSHRQSKIGERYRFLPGALDPATRREVADGKLECSFCAYLCLVAPEHLSRAQDGGFDASLGLAVRPTWSTAVDLEHRVPSKTRRKSGIDSPEMIMLRLCSVGVSEPFLQLSLLKRSILERSNSLSGIENCSRHTASTQVFDILEKWIRLCQHTHPSCRRESEIAGDSFTWSPTRLLDVSGNQPAAEDSVYLIRPIESSQRYDYVTLSYCWGPNPSFSKLTSKNSDAWKAGVPVNTLPKTFIDAIDATRRLGYRYLWIDALCIIQDSREDWLEQSLLMSKVFAYSTLTIAATASHDVHGGLYRDRDPAKVNGIDIAIRWPKLNTNPLGVQVYRVGLWSPWGSLLAHSPLAQRGWAFQERMLPARTLHFADGQVYWECFNHSASERYPNGTKLYVDVKDSLASRMVKQLKPLMALARMAEEVHVPYDVWSGIVEAYSRSKLTYESDKLVALAGLAMEIDQIFQGDHYLAGLWRSGLPYSLMWTADGDTDDKVVRPRKYRAPSWSWASLDGNITFPDIFKNTVAKVIDVAISTERDVFGPVIDGSLILKGHLFKLPQDLLEARFLCKTKDVSLPFHQGPAGFRLWWDRYQEDIDQQTDTQNPFCLPITAQSLSQNPHSIIRDPGLQGMKRQQQVFRGLLLEPLPKIKGRFHRVGDFEIVTSRSSIPRASSFKKLLKNISRSGEHNPVEERNSEYTIGDEFYRDYDGVDQYTIEIV